MGNYKGRANLSYDSAVKASVICCNGRTSNYRQCANHPVLFINLPAVIGLAALPCLPDRQATDSKRAQSLLALRKKEYHLK